MIPLSFAQRRIWFLHHLHGNNEIYNSSLALRLEGPLDRGAVRGALLDVVDRHEVLRTVFVESEGEVHQRILEPGEAMPHVQSVDGDVDEASLAGVLAEAVRQPFDLSVDIPLRAFLFSSGTHSHVLLLVVHHIAGDGWSLGPLWADFSSAYSARRRGGHVEWDELPVQYADYTLWQREVLGDAADPESVQGRQLAFWQKKLAGMPDEVVLPGARVRPAVPTRSSITVPLELDEAAYARVAELARTTDTTPFMVVQAAVAALLTKLGGGVDIPLGTAIAGRTDEALHDLVGFFVNTLVLRMDTSRNPTFIELLERTRDINVQAYANQDLPFERLVEELNPPRVPGRHPLFQVMLTFQNDALVDYALEGVDVTLVDVPNLGMDFDITFTLQETRNTLGKPCDISGRIEYAADLFDEGTSKRLSDGFAALFAQLVENPRLPLDAMEAPALEASRKTTVDARSTSAEGSVGRGYAAPTNAQEEALCGVFCEVFDRPRVGIHDNFFELGGHSLLAIRMVSRIRSTMNVNLAMRDLFEAPTVAMLSERLTTAPRSRPSLSRVTRRQ